MMAPATTAPPMTPAATPGPHPHPPLQPHPPRRHQAEASVALPARVAAIVAAASRRVSVFFIALLQLGGGRRVRLIADRYGPPITPPRQYNLANLSEFGLCEASRGPLTIRIQGLKETKRLAARAGAEASLPSALHGVDHMHGAIALAGDEQLVAAKRHVHGLAADPDCGLLAERRIDQAH